MKIDNYDSNFIWTGDKILMNGLKEKGYDICVTTKEIKTKTYKKSY